jgi:hypothetical protein
MGKYRSAKKIIQRAIHECSAPELREARIHLESAVRAVKQAESKNESQEKKAQGWVLDKKTGSLTNMSIRQFNKAIDRIEDMIEDEKKKTRANRSDVFLG